MLNLDEQVFLDKVVDGTMITGGHFMIIGSGQANLNVGTIQSFEIAVKVFKKSLNKGLRVGLGILVNNMGSVCDAKSKACVVDSDVIKDNFTLPKEYLNILSNNNVDPKDVIVYWEKSLRNRGKKELHKMIKTGDGSVALKEGAYWFADPKDGRKITLSRPNVNDEYGMAACPLIMAAFTYQIHQDGFDTGLHFYYVDIENEQNIPNYFAIEKGRAVAEHFYKKLKTINFYLLKDRIVSSF